MENDEYYEVNNTVSLEMDRDDDAAAAESQSESSSLSSSLESGLTVESSDSKKLDECGGWTNEKHNLYLDSLESSFVKQLYSLLGGRGTQTLSSRTPGLQSNSHKFTDQFTVLQNGYRQKVCFESKRAHLETSSEDMMGTDVQLCNEEIKSSGDMPFTRTSSLVHDEYLADQNTAEASGQNFREEEEVEEKGCNSEVSRKRRRGANFDDCSSNDQVVP